MAIPEWNTIVSWNGARNSNFATKNKRDKMQFNLKNTRFCADKGPLSVKTKTGYGHLIKKSACKQNKTKKKTETVTWKNLRLNLFPLEGSLNSSFATAFSSSVSLSLSFFLPRIPFMRVTD